MQVFIIQVPAVVLQAGQSGSWPGGHVPGGVRWWALFPQGIAMGPRLQYVTCCYIWQRSIIWTGFSGFPQHCNVQPVAGNVTAVSEIPGWISHD